MTDQFYYDVAFSFAGEDRDLVAYLATELRDDYAVFYDDFERSELWGADLTETLPQKYRNSRYCVIVQSPPYLKKVWTVLERQAIVYEFLSRRGKDFILPVRVSKESCEIPGISAVTGYITAYTQDDWENVLELLKEKLFT